MDPGGPISFCFVMLHPGFLAIDIPTVGAVTDALYVSNSPRVGWHRSGGRVERLRFRQPWNESWRRATSLTSPVLPSIYQDRHNGSERVCGPHMVQFGVSRTSGGQRQGVRCVFRTGVGLLLWYGAGRWSGGQRYEHIGFETPGVQPRFQAYDVLYGAIPARGSTSGAFPLGSIDIDVVRWRDGLGLPQSEARWVSRVQQFRVSGVWSEIWTFEFDITN